MNWLIYFSFSIYVIYIVVSLLKLKRVPDNLSDTYYLWSKNKYLFPLILSGASILMIPEWLQYSQMCNCLYLLLTAGTGIFIVCLFPDYKANETSFLIHVTSAYTAGFASAVLVLMINWVVLAVVFVISLIICLVFDKNKKTTFEFWLEFIVIISLYIIFMFNL